MKTPTHLVIDFTYFEDEGQEVFEGSYEDCQAFICKQSDYFMYKTVPINAIP